MDGTSPAVRVSVTVSFVGGPRDGESSRLVSGEPVAVLVVDDTGGRYEWRGHIRGASAPGDFQGRYYWEP